jgi:glyoxalase family protein
VTDVALAGTHHVSALSARIAVSHDFYTRVIGLRPVVRTVNQDDPGMYHLFFGDGAGSPGSDITVFDMPRAASERHGNNSISLTTFRVAGSAALEYWQQRLAEHGVATTEIHERDGRAVLDFDDPVGTRLSLVDDGSSGPAFPWEPSPVPLQYQSCGLGYVRVTVPELAPTHEFLVRGLGLTAAREYPVSAAPRRVVHVYEMGGGGAHAEVHVAVRSDLPGARYGSGGVHHVALRVPDLDAIHEWPARLEGLGYVNSGVVDRHWFRSVYVREPNHVLFELATDGPGFEVDGSIDGERLALPPALEPRRAEIEAGLVPLD